MSDVYSSVVQSPYESSDVYRYVTLFFFQAEDGIRDLVRSRGLGDVYKRQLEYGLEDIMKLRPVSYSWTTRPESGTKLGLIAQELETVIPEAVSYTHLTLPTSDLV